MRAEKPLELKHVLIFCLYVVISVACLLWESSAKVVSIVQELRL